MTKLKITVLLFFLDLFILKKIYFVPYCQTKLAIPLIKVVYTIPKAYMPKFLTVKILLTIGINLLTKEGTK